MEIAKFIISHLGFKYSIIVSNKDSNNELINILQQKSGRNTQFKGNLVLCDTNDPEEMKEFLFMKEMNINQFLSLSNFDCVYTESLLNIDNFNNLQNDGFIFGTTKLIKIFQYDSRFQYIVIDDLLIAKKTLTAVEWMPKYFGALPIETKSLPIHIRQVKFPMDLFDHYTVLELMAKRTKNCVYLEYGVCDGKSATRINKQVNEKDCYCVDISDHLITNEFKNKFNFYLMSTDDFSRNHLPNTKFNLAFIDADHKSDSTFKDFINIFKYAPVDSYIMLHDTYPCHADLLRPDACHDCYKTPMLIQGLYDHCCQMLTLPFNPGFTIVKKL